MYINGLSSAGLPLKRISRVIDAFKQSPGDDNHNFCVIIYSILNVGKIFVSISAMTQGKFLASMLENWQHSIFVGKYLQDFFFVVDDKT